jgi:hypothetical protein
VIRNIAGWSVRLRPARGTSTGGAVGLLLWLLVALPGCGALGPAPIDLAPGQRVVFGRVDLSGAPLTNGILEIVRVDGNVAVSLPLALTPREFAIGLPPGRYRVTELRGSKDGRIAPNQVVWGLRLAFVVGPEPATYIGTVRFAGAFDQQLSVSVEDELDDTLRVLRRRYSNLPATTARALLGPA